MFSQVENGKHLSLFQFRPPIAAKEFPASVTASVAPPTIGANKHIITVYIIIFSN
jgi:hypothetical protein